VGISGIKKQQKKPYFSKTSNRLRIKELLQFSIERDEKK